MTYRPDIDGLRAVAVIAVILFHLNAAWLPGGFLGVDIFFVISGYLIGGILIANYPLAPSPSNGSISAECDASCPPSLQWLFSPSSLVRN